MVEQTKPCIPYIDHRAQACLQAMVVYMRNIRRDAVHEQKESFVRSDFANGAWQKGAEHTTNEMRMYKLSGLKADRVTRRYLARFFRALVPLRGGRSASVLREFRQIGQTALQTELFRNVQKESFVRSDFANGAWRK